MTSTNHFTSLLPTNQLKFTSLMRQIALSPTLKGEIDVTKARKQALLDMKVFPQLDFGCHMSRILSLNIEKIQLKYGLKTRSKIQKIEESNWYKLTILIEDQRRLQKV